jgi:glycosyltransferase involved in cell wall biosynthesis
VSPRALFVSHAADRTGPPIFLLGFLRWLRANTDVEVAVALQRSGPLREDFAALGEVLDLHGDVPTGPVLDASPYDVVVLNASWTVRSLPAIEHPRAVVSFVHEMEDVLRFLLDDEDRDALLRRSDRIVVGCRAAKDNLVHRHGVPPDRIVSVPYSAEPRPLGGAVAAVRRAVRSELGLSPDGPVLVGAGVYDWRKAPDLLLHVAWHLHGLGVPCEVVWVGDDTERPAWCDWDEEAARLGLSDSVRRVPSTPALARVLAAGDVFVLPSREDTFPLVCLEAAAVGLPTVCFDDTGTVELVEERAGRRAGAAVPYPDLAAMAAALERLLVDPAERAAAGEEARRRFEEEHRPEVVLPALHRALAPWLAT